MTLVLLESAFYALFNDTSDKAMACSQQKLWADQCGCTFTAMCAACILLTPIYIKQNFDKCMDFRSPKHKLCVVRKHHAHMQYGATRFTTEPYTWGSLYSWEPCWAIGYIVWMMDQSWNFDKIDFDHHSFTVIQIWPVGVAFCYSARWPQRRF